MTQETDTERNKSHQNPTEKPPETNDSLPIPTGSTLNVRLSNEGLSSTEQLHWNWTQQQLTRVRSAFVIDPNTTPMKAYLHMAWKQSLLGMALPFLGGKYIIRHRRLWKWAGTPILISLLLSLVTIGIVALLLGASVASIAAVYSTVDGWIAGAGMATIGVISVIAAVLIFGILAAILMYGIIILCGPFFEFLAESTEDLEANILWNNWDAPKFSWSVLMRNLLLTVVSAGFFLLMPPILSALVTIIPVIGWIIGPAIFLTFFGWQWTGEYIGTVRLWPIQDKLRFIKQHFWMFLGSGIVLTIISITIPLISMPFLVPCSIVGFTITLLWLQHEGSEVPVDRRMLEGTNKFEIL